VVPSALRAPAAGYLKRCHLAPIRLPALALSAIVAS
jgi:hypothetical protein